jgi:hypothetical protein
MSERRFLHSPPGRLGCLSLTIALSAAGGIAIVGPRSNSFALISLAVALCLVSAMFTVFVAPVEFVLRTVVMLARTIVLTPVYVVALMALQGAGNKPAGVALLALSVLPILVALGGTHGSRDARSSSGPHGQRKWIEYGLAGDRAHVHGAR